jgi:16S rRNA (cytidine1402-2'-O)-methyltransferase
MPLYVVSTPVGNVEDVSLRALRVLQEVDLVLAEDTRETGKLLARVGVKARFRAYHDHTSDSARVALVQELVGGMSMALVSDAGTPCLSDPGYALVRDARDAGVTVVPVPGASALLAFIAAAGLPTDRFQFVGFAPRKEAARASHVAEWLAYAGTTVCYESPKRLVSFLESLAARDPGVQVAVGRELTKRFEEFVTGTSSEVLSEFASRESVKGEVVVGIVGSAPVVSDEELEVWVDALVGAGVRTKDVAQILSQRLGAQRSQVYELALKRKAERDE